MRMGLSMCVLAAGLAAGMMIALPDKVSAQEKVVIYSAEEVLQDFAARYMKEHPGVNVQVLLGSSGENNARVAAEKDNPQGDVTISGTDPSLANPDLYRKAADTLDLNNVDKRFLYGDYAVTVMVFPVIYAVNVKQLGSDAPPATWAELGDPKWKGRLYMGNPATSEAAYKTLATLWSIGGWDLVEKVASNAIITAGSQDPLRALGNSEAAIGVGVENQVYKWADGNEVKAVYPTDGVIMHFGTWYLINKSPNPKGGADFVQWMLTPEVQSHMANTYRGMRPSIVGATEPSGVPTVSDLKIIPFPDEARNERAAFNERWKDIITSIH